MDNDFQEYATYDKSVTFTPIEAISIELATLMTSASMIGVYSRIHNVLRDRTLSITIHCDDDFYVFDKDASTQNTRVYRDTRSTGVPRFMTLDEPKRLCHEGGGGNGWQMWNEVTLEDDICICPRVFTKAGTSQTLSSLDNSMDSLRGRQIDDIKTFTAAGSLLHELSHCRSILGDHHTKDMTVQPYRQGPVIPGYQRNGVWTVSKANPAEAHRNAGNSDSA
ncbi:hypothetical protein AAWM_03487 [Aspergillus awamori]|uniref:Lysine-specific metallo-endopeptidase domain-containing protein n=1 Tax=Aspergillus awamori TaxID=105351 RepID=A0A401KMW4_ASPAW|nr:hypothetical protein AAWM_03487 [Aspergillus awamori]